MSCKRRVAPTRSSTLAALTWALSTMPRVSTEQVPFAAVHLLWRRRSRAAPFFGGLDALAVQDARARLRESALPGAFLLPQHGQNLLPTALDPPQPPVVIDRLPRWKVVRQQPPGTPGPKPVRQRVDDLTPLVHRRTSTQLDWRDRRSKSLPLDVTQVGRGMWHASRFIDDLPCPTRVITWSTYPINGLFRHPLGTVCLPADPVIHHDRPLHLARIWHDDHAVNQYGCT